MKIEKLEINGFKSFANPVSFILHPGITCIVGPNGCGKSNIVDAFKWVIGEQSVRTLRSDKMEEVIFNGTNMRKPHGMAHVTLYIANNNRSDSSYNVTDNNKTLISRRLFRSGESEYIVNNVKSRLKDIRDFFLDTGLEVRSYSILEQGKISQILEAKPVDRRFLIEEVAGVMKFKVRKHEALNKLEHSRANLERINDITREVKRSLDSLSRQSRKAERFKKLTFQLNTIELKLSKRDYEQLKVSFKSLSHEQSELIKETDNLIERLKYLETEKDEKRVYISEKEKALNSMSSSSQLIEKDISSIEKEIAIKETEMINFKAQIEKLKEQKNEYISDIEQVNSELEGLPEKEKEVNDIIASINKELEIEETNIKSTEDSFASSQNELKEKNLQFYRISEEISETNNEILKIQSTIDTYSHRKESSKKMSYELQSDIENLDREINENNREMNNKQGSNSLLHNKRGPLLIEIKGADKYIDNLSQHITTIKEKLASNTARHKSLKEITQIELNIEAFSRHINIVAYIPEILNVHSKYITAIESALSEKIKGFVLKCKDDLKDAINFIKENSIERQSFISLEHITNKRSNKIHSSEYIPALNVIETSVEYRNIIKAILMDYLIVADLETAFRLHKNNMENGDDRIPYYVTLDGDILEPSGVVISGKGKNILSHLNEIKELEKVILENSTDLQKTESKINQLITEKNKLNGSLEEIETLITISENELSILTLNRERHIEEKERTEKKLFHLQIESEEIVKDSNSLFFQLETEKSKLHSLQTDKEEIKDKINDIHDKTSKDRSLLESLRSSLINKKMEVAEKNEQLKSIFKEKAAITNKIQSIKQKMEKIYDENLLLEDKEKETSTNIEVSKQKLRHFISEADLLKEKTKSVKEVIETEFIKLQDIEKMIKPLRNEIDILKDKTNNLNIQLTENRIKMDNIQTTVHNNYGKDIDVLAVEPLLDGEEEKAVELREKIQSFGPVNLTSIEEFEEIKSRYDFLTSQKEDLTKSIAELEQAISKMNSMTRSKLNEAFKTLNVKFHETFKILFDGGNAELILTEPNNILDSGIEILVQPPGKKLQNINLLSGGEKSLSALSLVFAGFLIKSTPLCILDEADAFLDETNSRKFTEMIKELSNTTQFIIITHNRTTMEIADHLYGITAEEAGVSKIISAQFTES